MRCVDVERCLWANIWLEIEAQYVDTVTEVQTKEEIFSFVDTDEEETLICVFDKNGMMRIFIFIVNYCWNITHLSTALEPIIDFCHCFTLTLSKQK